MKKLLLLTILFVLAFTISVSAASNLTITDATTSLTGNVSEAVVGSFKLDNTGTEDLQGITLGKTEFKGLTETFTIPAGKISFQPSGYKSVLNDTETPSYNFTINIPSNAFQDTYKGNITATDTTGDHTAEFEVTLLVNPNKALSGEDVTLTIVQGLQGKVNLTLTNDGNTDVDVAADWTLGDGASSDLGKDAILVQAPAKVKYAESEKALITVTVPEDQAAGEYTSTITFTYDGEEFNQTLKVNVQTKNEDVTLTSPSVTWAIDGVSTSESAKLKITNSGNVDLTGITLSLADLLSGTNEISKSKVSFNTAAFDLAKGAEKEVTFTLSGVLADQIVGTYQGTITADWGTDNKTSTFTAVLRTPEKKLEVPSSVSLGDSSSLRNATYTTTFDITNTGDYALGNLNVSSTAADKYLVKFSIDGTNWLTSLNMGTLTKSTAKTLHVQVYAPESMDSGIVDIGNILFGADEDFTATIADFKLTTKSFLIINDAEIFIDGDDESLDDNDVINDVKPGAKIKIEFELKNMFNEDDTAEEDMDIDNIEVTVESKDDIGDGDVDETSEEIDLNPGDDDKVTVEFTIDDEADEDTYEFTVKVEGEDTEDSKHTTEWTFSIKVEKDDHDIDIAKAELQDSTLSCLRDTRLNILIRNLGQDDEDEVRLKVLSPVLGINIDNRDIELSNDVGDDDNEYSFSVPVTLSDDFTEGTYKITVETFYEDTKSSDDKDVVLTVGKCSLDSPSSSSNDDDDDADTGSIVIQTPTQGSASTPSTPTVPSTLAPSVTVTETTAASFRNSNIYIGLLLVAVIVVAIAVVMLATKGFGPKYKY
ncbi:MAG: hypothetical protein U9R08_02200 [Nanoarchaeota archaeon]|nr:hypothetical protein [Nanoarchaeota archaeon]